MIGKVYGMPPQPHDPQHTRMLPAGVVTFGVEYRDLDPDSLRATYAGNAEHLAELEEKSPEGGFIDEGVSIHVFGTDDHHEYLRFDLLADEPHYHYIHPATEPGGDVVNNVIDFDIAAHGEMLPWAIECLRSRLPSMLTEAGAGGLAAGLDPETVGRVAEDVRAVAEEAELQRNDAIRSAR